MHVFYYCADLKHISEDTGFIHDEKSVTGRHYLSSSETEFGVVETVLAILSNTNLLL